MCPTPCKTFLDLKYKTDSIKRANVKWSETILSSFKFACAFDKMKLTHSVYKTCLPDIIQLCAFGWQVLKQKNAKLSAARQALGNGKVFRIWDAWKLYCARSLHWQDRLRLAFDCYSSHLKNSALVGWYHYVSHSLAWAAILQLIATVRKCFQALHPLDQACVFCCETPGKSTTHHTTSAMRCYMCLDSVTVDCLQS